MAYLVSRPGRPWELRESRATPSGPRSRTLVTFRTLTDQIVVRAVDRSAAGLSPGDVRRICLAAGTGAPAPATDQAAHALLAELKQGRSPSPGLRMRLQEALSAVVPELDPAAHGQDDWARWSAADHGQALRGLLGLADRLPAPRRRGLAYPPLGRVAPPP
jgi:hypothetical protein